MTRPLHGRRAKRAQWLLDADRLASEVDWRLEAWLTLSAEDHAARVLCRESAERRAPCAPADEEEQVAMLDRPTRIAAIRAAFAASPAIILEYRGDSTPDLAIRSGDPSEPGKLRVTYLAPDGPRGHVSRRDLEGCIEHVADLCPASVRPATEDEVIAWTSTPAYVAGAAQVAQVQRDNEARRQAAREGR